MNLSDEVFNKLISLNISRSESINSDKSDNDNNSNYNEINYCCDIAQTKSKLSKKCLSCNKMVCQKHNGDICCICQKMVCDSCWKVCKCKFCNGKTGSYCIKCIKKHITFIDIFEIDNNL